MTEMQAGRELDAEVARRVFGHGEIVEWSPGYPVYYERVGEKEMRSRALPPYSTDIAAAWTIVEHFEAEGGEWSMGMFRGTKTYEFVLYRRDHISVFGRADSVPLAICRAALAAVTP